MLYDLTRQRGHLARDRNFEFQQALRLPVHIGGKREDYASFEPSTFLDTVETTLGWLSEVRNSGHWANVYMWPGFTKLWDGAFYEFSFGWDPVAGIEGEPWPLEAKAPLYQHDMARKVMTPSRMPEHAWSAIQAAEEADPALIMPVYVVERRIHEDLGRPVVPADDEWDERPNEWRWILWFSGREPNAAPPIAEGIQPPGIGGLRWRYLGSNEGQWTFDKVTWDRDEGLRVRVEWPKPEPLQPTLQEQWQTVLKALEFASAVRNAGSRKADPAVGKTAWDAVRRTWRDFNETYDKMAEATRDDLDVDEVVRRATGANDRDDDLSKLWSRTDWDDPFG